MSSEPVLPFKPGHGGPTLAGRPLVVRRFKRSEGDCLRAAVHKAYGFSYGETPDQDWTIKPAVPDEPEAQELWATWNAWARDRGLRWWVSDEWAPVGLDRWIACVDALNTPGAFHAVAMAGIQLLHDSNEGSGGRAYTSILPRDVRRAYALLPADQPSYSGRAWAITNPAFGPPRHTIRVPLSNTPRKD